MRKIQTTLFRKYETKNVNTLQNKLLFQLPKLYVLFFNLINIIFNKKITFFIIRSFINEYLL
jgi:hypothetical protein